MKHKAINFNEKLNSFSEHWKPKVIAEMNDYQFKLVKLQGDFIWHEHADTDETFIVIEGSLRIDLPDREVTLGKGEMFVVPKGTQHKPYAEKETMVMVIEPKGVVNTGDGDTSEITAENDQWI